MGFVFWALVEGDFEAVGEQLLTISTSRAGADPHGFRAAVAETVEEWFGARSRDYSIARLLLRELALGAGYGIVFPRELMLLARALVNLEATAAVVDPGLSLAELARPLLPELRRALLLDPRALEEAWHENRFEYLELALELPDSCPSTHRGCGVKMETLPFRPTPPSARRGGCPSSGRLQRALRSVTSCAEEVASDEFCDVHLVSVVAAVRGEGSPATWRSHDRQSDFTGSSAPRVRVETTQRGTGEER